MVSKSIVLLALSASVAVASPYGHARFHKGTGMRGTGGHAWPTGGHDHFNGTESGVAYPSSGHRSFTVSHVSEASASANLESDDYPSTAVAVASDTTSTCYSTSTEYETTVNYVTVTAGPGRDAASASSTTVSISAVSAVNAAVQNHNWPSNGQSWNWPSTTMATHVTSASQISESPVATSQAVVPTSAKTTVATSAAVSVSSAASSAAATTPASSGSSSGGKKGLSYNTPSLLSLFSGAGASWSYNWGLAAGGSMPSGIEYVPMCWGSAAAASCASTIASSGAEYMLSFNEPDNAGQANMPDASAAAQLHIKDISTPLGGKIKIGSPAVTNSGTSGQGLSWLSSFLQACNPSKSNDACKLDFLAIHWYSDAQYYSTFVDHVNGAIALAKEYNVPGGVWVTEFAATGSASDQVTFLSQAIPFLESTTGVSRYAYFMVDADGSFGMTSGSSLNTVGKAYVA